MPPSSSATALLLSPHKIKHELQTRCIVQSWYQEICSKEGHSLHLYFFEGFSAYSTSKWWHILFTHKKKEGDILSEQEQLAAPEYQDTSEISLSLLHTAVEEHQLFKLCEKIKPLEVSKKKKPKRTTIPSEKEEKYSVFYCAHGGRCTLHKEHVQNRWTASYASAYCEKLQMQCYQFKLKKKITRVSFQSRFCKAAGKSQVSLSRFFHFTNDDFKDDPTSASIHEFCKQFKKNDFCSLHSDDDSEEEEEDDEASLSTQSTNSTQN